MRTSVIPLLIVGFTSTALAPAAQAPDPDRLVACFQMQDAALRLQCFDREIAPLAAQSASAAGTPLVQEQVASSTAIQPVAPRATLPDFGQEQLKPRDQAPSADEAGSLNARISSLRKAGQGIYLVTLDNGQTWSHEDGSQAEYLTVGETVTITRASMGSYRLTRDGGKSKNWIRVTRVR